jgi:hypothetical protein
MRKVIIVMTILLSIGMVQGQENKKQFTKDLLKICAVPIVYMDEDQTHEIRGKTSKI